MLKKLSQIIARRRRKQVILLSTCMRSGSTWVYNLLGHLFQTKLSDLEFFRPEGENSADAKRRCQETLKVINQKPKATIFKTHRVPIEAIALLLQEKPNLKVVNIHRDFKDVLVSHLFYIRYRWNQSQTNKRAEWIVQYDEMSDEDMINSFIGTKQYEMVLGRWASYHVPFEHERYLALQYEDMLTAYEENVEKLAAFVGVDDRDVISNAIVKCHFSNMATDVQGRSPGEMVKYDHCRKGISGDFKNYMTEESIARCEKDVQESLSLAVVPDIEKLYVGESDMLFWKKKKEKNSNSENDECQPYNREFEVSDFQASIIEGIPPLEVPQKTFIVLGCPRGGTSMLSGILRLYGIWMGDNLGQQHENKESFSRDVPLKTKIEKIREYNSLYNCWGWKCPNTVHWLGDVLNELRNPHFIVVYRNPFDIAMSSAKHDGRIFSERLLNVPINHYKKMHNILEKTQAPRVYVSYERGLCQKEELVEKLASFVGVAVTDEMRSDIYQFIDPKKGYQRL